MPKLPRPKPERVVRALRRAGFVDYRQKGSHRTMHHPETGRNVTVPIHPSSLCRRVSRPVTVAQGQRTASGLLVIRQMR